MRAVQALSFLFLCALLLGCNQSSSPESSEVTADSPPATEQEPTRAPSPATPAANTGNNAEADLAALTQAVRRYAAEKRKVPASIGELAGAGYIEQIPSPPAGKRFVITPRLEVVLE